MARRSTAKEKVFFKLPEDWNVTNVREVSERVFFTLNLPGLSLYNLRIVEYSKGDFIGMPQDWNGKKGDQAEYYNKYSLYLSDEDTEKIIAAVDKALAEK